MTFRRHTPLRAGALSLGLAVLLLAAPGARAYTLTMPFRATSLSDSTYLQSSGHTGYNCGGGVSDGNRFCPLDISARRFVPSAGTDGDWTKWRPGAAGSPPFADEHVLFGAPLYAPVDGHVIACWRRMPDDLVENDNQNCPGGTDVCASGGNALSIRTEDGRIVTLNHLRADSIPASLCPIDEVYLYKDAPSSCALPGNQGFDGWKDAMRLDLRGIQPIPVEKGQFVGEVGTSGKSGGAHLHLSVREYGHDGESPCKGPHERIELVETWRQAKSASTAPDTSWLPFEDEPLPIDGTTWLLWPDPIGPRTDSLQLGAGSRPQVWLRDVTDDQATVAYRSDSGKLVVTAVRSLDGQLAAFDEEIEGRVSRIALTGVNQTLAINGGEHTVAAVVNGQQKLQVIPYERIGTQLHRGTGRIEGSASKVDATPSPHPWGFVAAVRNGERRLQLISYDLNYYGNELRIDRRDSATAPSQVRQIAVATITEGRGVDESGSRSFRGVVTAERRDSDDAVVVRAWRVDGSTGDLQQTDADTARSEGTGAKYAVTDLDVAVVGNDNREFVVVSSRLKGSQDLRVQTFEIRSNGHLARLDQADAGTISKLGLTDAGRAEVVSAISDGAGDLRLISWQVEPGSGERGEIRRSGTRRAGPISGVDVAAGAIDLLVAVRGGNGRIQLLNYETNFSRTE